MRSGASKHKTDFLKLAHYTHIAKVLERGRFDFCSSPTGLRSIAMAPASDGSAMAIRTPPG